MQKPSSIVTLIILGLALSAGSFLVGGYAARIEQPAAQQQAPEEQRSEKTPIETLAERFTDEPLQGGQRSPRLSRWLNDRTFMFIQLDKRDPKEATAVRLVGLGVKGNFCKQTQPKGADFRHFHRLVAEEYAQGHGGAPNDEGYWLFSIAAEDYTAGDRTIHVGETTAFPVTEPPDCPEENERTEQ